MTDKKLCFVIMGFGKKTDPSTGITLDLDQTYKNIIRPAVISADHECVRADEIQESGIIDKPMYALLMQADLVIADISTYNPNAIYELGVRHAVRPFATIILKEKEGKIPFDLDHSRIFQYTHAGADIGADEANRCQTALASLIRSISNKNRIDSPLYEYIQHIEPPKLPIEDYREIVKGLADKEKHIFAVVETAKEFMKAEKFAEAAIRWLKAAQMVPSESFFVQQRALCIYKSGLPTKEVALVDALSIINALEPDGNTNDPETLGITGAIYKNLWVLKSEIEYLNRAIHFYGKCFNIRDDYYTGENYALCLDMKAAVENEVDEKTYSRMAARKARQAIISRLENDLHAEEFNVRPDKMWIYATLSQCYFALGKPQESEKFRAEFERCKPLTWEKSTFENVRAQLTALLSK